MKLTLNKWLLIYSIAIQLALALILVKSNALFLIERKLGLEEPQQELSAYYKTLLSFHLKTDKNSQDNSTIFIGDSHTQGLATSSITNLSINFGIASDTTIGVLNRIKLYTAIEKSRLIVLSIGINDLFIRDNDEVVRNYEEILDSLPSSTPIISSALFLFSKKAQHNRKFNSRIQSLNLSIQELATHKRNVHFLSNEQIFLGINEGVKIKNHTHDGIHLSKAGYQLWIAALKNKINHITNNKEDGKP